MPACAAALIKRSHWQTLWRHNAYWWPQINKEKGPELIRRSRTEAYLITTQVLFKPPFFVLLQTLKCPAKINRNPSTSRDRVHNCWMLFADRPPRALLNRRSDKLSKLVEAVDCGTEIIVPASRLRRSQKVGRFSPALHHTETDSLCFDSFTYINAARLTWPAGRLRLCKATLTF